MNPTISLRKRICLALAAFAAVLAIVAIAASPLLAQGKQVKKVPLSPDSAVLTDGKELFLAVCAVCHGKTGKGDGPAAAALKADAADLTVLARENGGEFPAARVMGSIQGKLSSAHGTEEMPMWGPIFRSASNETQAALRISNLTGYIRSIQVN